MGQLRTIEKDLQELGFQIIAASADRPEKLSGTVEKNSLTYQLVSDSTMAASRAFGLAFQVDDKTLAAYKGYGIDLEEASGEEHHLLPVPGVFLISKEGVVEHSYVNPDYRIRLDPAVILAAARSMAGK